MKPIQGTNGYTVTVSRNIKIKFNGMTVTRDIDLSEGNVTSLMLKEDFSVSDVNFHFEGDLVTISFANYAKTVVSWNELRGAAS